MKGSCDSVVPPFKEMGDGHIIACHLSEDELRAIPPVFEVKSAPASE
jgi:hypothetical protein